MAFSCRISSVVHCAPLPTTEGQVKFVDHGLGLEIDEYPVISPRFHMPLEEGMVLALEPKFVFPGEGVVGMEDDYLVTPSGLERITLTEQKISRMAW